MFNGVVILVEEKKTSFFLSFYHNPQSNEVINSMNPTRLNDGKHEKMNMWRERAR